MLTRQSRVIIACIACAVWSVGATDPDQATRRWWNHVRVLASDGMQGRDTGSLGHRKAAEYVAESFKRSGLRPAGDAGYFQPVPLQAARFQADRSSLSLIAPNGRVTPMRWLRDVMTAPRLGLPESFDAELVFEGYDVPADVDIKGRILVVLAPPRFVPGPHGYVRPPPPGSRATIMIESPAGPEPARWPSFLSTTMTRAAVPLPSAPVEAPFFMSLNPALADTLFAHAPHTYGEMRRMAEAGEQLPTFPLGVRMRGRIAVEIRSVTSDNVLGILPGSDQTLANEYVVLSAHLDAYGVGEPVGGDRIYNGAFDDAAYIATLLEFAERLQASGTRFKRSLIFAAFTGEEKGLLGSEHFVAQPAVAKDRIVANINLDGLRPLFSLRHLTTFALDDSTLGDAVRRAGAALNISIEADREPERGLVRRSDQWNFLRSGIPAVSFAFGLEAGSAEEKIYRRWYADRYHSPSDDLNQPWDPSGAARFNEFFRRLVEDVANDPRRPEWKPGRATLPNEG